MLHPSAQHGAWHEVGAQPLSREQNSGFSDTHTQQSHLPHQETWDDCNKFPIPWQSSQHPPKAEVRPEPRAEAGFPPAAGMPAALSRQSSGRRGGPSGAGHDKRSMNSSVTAPQPALARKRAFLSDAVEGGHRFTADRRESARQLMIRAPGSLAFPPSPPTWICQPGTLPYPEPVLSKQRGWTAREAHLFAPGSDSWASQENNYSRVAAGSLPCGAATSCSATRRGNIVSGAGETRTTACLPPPPPPFASFTSLQAASSSLHLPRGGA